MNNEFVALQGKTFTVELQSMAGSTNYSWCVASMPEEIILMGMENIPVRPGIAPVIQRFYFGVVSSAHTNIQIDFCLTCWSELTKTAEHFQANIRIVPSDTEEFVSYSENETKAAMPYGFIYAGDGRMKYGYPCAVQDASVKYGYPCGAQDALLKYGYPCGVQDASVKYGYPCMETSKEARPYGYPLYL